MAQRFDAHSYHIKHSNISSRQAFKYKQLSPNFIASTAWQHTLTGLEVVNEDEEPFLATIVGRTSTYHLRCGPAGNHFSGGMSPLEKTKFQFHICRPVNPELGADFTAAINNLETLQNQVGKTKEHKNMIVEDVTGKMMHFASNVFMTRVRIEYATDKEAQNTLQDEIVPDSPHGQNALNAPKMDEETRDWPIPDELVKEFDALKYKFEVHHLPLYHEDHLVQPIHANEILNGAMVEVQFHIQHWRIKDIDSFQATPQRVTVLKLGPIRVPSNYKRRMEDEDTEQPEAKRTHLNAEAGTSKVVSEID
ncbi:hypothetical protein DFJ58DRAFT_734644 [Suillus subalutaceus]|uniref:uncharacterized protein n=1 Tax=Suillus subalutaceus TaxID=48586 RepID=UPI001B86D2ED|nr:uncharacterized protein DFJ58DRAFT_734644 [Suillus subalutaceus]KAG1836947.1 hypothetical protein DFJ58DRAFT_734644 [Suillus subalutaceus]